MNQFYIHALLFFRNASFIPLHKLVDTYNENLPYGRLSMSQLALTFVYVVMESYFSLFNYPLRIILTEFCRYMCFYYRLSGWKNIIFLTPNCWRNYLNELSHMTSVCKFKDFFDRERQLCYLQASLFIGLSIL